MRQVLLLLPGAFSGYGGIEMFNRQLVRAFLELGSAQGFHVETLILNDRTEDVDDRYIPRGTSQPRGFRRQRLAFVGEAIRKAFAGRPDLVVFGHLHFTRLAPFVHMVSHGCRFWAIAYGIEAWHPFSPSINRGLARVETTLSISEFTRRRLAENGGPPIEQIELLPCAIDPVWQEQYEPRPDVAASMPTGGPPTLLTVARLAATERYKGIDSVIRALPGVVKEVPGVVYDVVGDGDDLARLKALAREMGVAGRVRFRGRLWPDELADAYRNCTLYVMPSSHEGFGIVFLEAALFGKASVGGLHGGTPEVIEDGVSGVLVDREDVLAVERALLALLTNQRLLSRMGKRARARALENYTYPGFRARLEKYFATLSPTSSAGGPSQAQR